MKFYFKCSNCLLDIETSKTNYYRNLKKEDSICRKCHIEISSKNLSVIVQGVRITKHKFYSRWVNLIKRCYDENNINYKYYGGRGITVCDEWKDSLNFINWCIDYENKVGVIPKNHHLDRIDNEKGYCPTNCQFIPPRENNRKRDFVKLNYKKAEEIREKYSEGARVVDLAKTYNVSKHCIYDCLSFRTFKDN